MKKLAYNIEKQQKQHVEGDGQLRRKWWENRRLFLLFLLIMLVGMFTIFINEVTQNQHLQQMSEFQLYTSQYENAQSIELNLDNILVLRRVNPFAHQVQIKLANLIANEESSDLTALAQQANIDVVRQEWKKAIDEIVHYKSLVHNRIGQAMDTMMRDIRFEKATTIYSLGFDIVLTMLLVFFMIKEERGQLKQTRRALSQSESRLSAAMMNLPVILFALDASGTFITAMGKRLKDIEIQAESLIGENIYEMYTDYPEIIAHIRLAMQVTTNEVAFTDQITFNSRIFEISYVALDEDEHHHKILTGIALDITEHKAVEAALQQSEEHFRMLFEMNRTAPAFLVDPKDGKLLNVNEAAIEHYGWNREEFLGKNVLDISQISREELHTNMLEFMNGDKERSIYEHRLASGEKRLMEVYSAPFYDGNRQLLYSVVHDVTARKRMEETLRLADVAFETADAMTITDEDGIILRVNQSFTKVTGYEQHEVVGKNPRILQSGLHDKLFYEHFWESLKNQGTWEGEIWNKRKNGEIYPEWITIRAVKDETNLIVNYIATFFDLTEKKVLEANIERLSHYDPLTGLANRRLIMEQLKLSMENARLRQNIGGLILIDLDRFKYLNDARGHEMGDVLLSLVAQKLEGILSADAVASRFGGDEFVILMSDLANEKETAWSMLQYAMNDIFQALVGNYPIGDSMYALTVSIGATIFSNNNQTYEDIVKEADMAMHVAKDRGRNMIVLFEEEMMTATENRFSLEEDLYYALDRNELELVYQPQTDHDGNLRGVEALLRWHHQKRGLISPERFIPIAEESGLIVPIGEWVLKQSCLLLRQLIESGQQVFVSVNVSPRQFHEANFVEMVMGIIAETGVDPHYLTIEVTEGVLIDYAENTIAKMQRLSQLGVHFSIDDFGTGYSSLAYLKNLPLNELKIDRSFVVDMMTIPSSEMIVETIIAMASHLGLSVIAEGVESADQVRFLVERGCNNFQGYYFSPPLPYEKFTAFVAEAH